MDEQTMKDYIEDLLEERAKLYERIGRMEKRYNKLLDATLNLRDWWSEQNGNYERHEPFG